MATMGAGLMSERVESAPVIEAGLFTIDPPALLGGRCLMCGAVRFPHRRICAVCQAAKVERVPLSTTGTIYTFTVVRTRPPGYLGDVPYAFGFVDLPEGLRVIATILADDLDAIAVGDTVDFELLALGTGSDAVLAYGFRRRPVTR